MNDSEYMNIEHVNNLNTIASLEKQGFEGIDADLATSLFEYGFAWKNLGDETLFIYGIRIDNGGEYDRFDSCTIANDVDVEQEFDWAESDSILSYVGMSREDWLAMPLTSKVHDLLSHYGFENVFGSSYWEGFAIAE